MAQEHIIVSQSKTLRYSIILFEAKLHDIVIGLPLHKLAPAIANMRKISPVGGTNYSCGWNAVRIACELVKADQHEVLFLSDGCPDDNDLGTLGAHEDTEIDDVTCTARWERTIRHLASQYREDLTVHAIAIGWENSAYLERVAKLVDMYGREIVDVPDPTAGEFMFGRLMDIPFLERMAKYVTGAVRSDPGVVLSSSGKRAVGRFHRIDRMDCAAGGYSTSNDKNLEGLFPADVKMERSERVEDFTEMAAVLELSAPLRERALREGQAKLEAFRTWHSYVQEIVEAKEEARRERKRAKRAAEEAAREAARVRQERLDAEAAARVPQIIQTIKENVKDRQKPAVAAQRSGVVKEEPCSWDELLPKLADTQKKRESKKRQKEARRRQRDLRSVLKVGGVTKSDDGTTKSDSDVAPKAQRKTVSFAAAIEEDIPEPEPEPEPELDLDFSDASDGAGATKQSTSLSDTFSIISSSISSGGKRSREPKFEETAYLQDSVDWEKLGNTNSETALRLKETKRGGWSTGTYEETVKFCDKPFAKGGQRNAFHITLPRDTQHRYATTKEGKHAAHHVAKESRWKGGDLHQWKSDYTSEKKATNLATSLVRKFTREVLAASEVFARQKNLRITGAPPQPSILAFELYGIKVKGSEDRVVCVERYLEGEWQKRNGNNGYVHKESAESLTWEGLMPHAFSHWTYEDSLKTKSQEGDVVCLVCDIQGVGTDWTDVAICTEDRRFGSTDLGEVGIQNFFRTHRCNSLCKLLDLTYIKGPAHGDEKDLSASIITATSAIEIIKTRHLNERKEERDIDTLELQKAYKHGTKEPGHYPGTVKHTHGGVVLVTGDSTGILKSNPAGVTAYRRADIEVKRTHKLSGTQLQAQNAERIEKKKEKALETLPCGRRISKKVFAMTPKQLKKELKKYQIKWPGRGGVDERAWAVPGASDVGMLLSVRMELLSGLAEAMEKEKRAEQDRIAEVERERHEIQRKAEAWRNSTREPDSSEDE